MPVVWAKVTFGDCAVADFNSLLDQPHREWSPAIGDVIEVGSGDAYGFGKVNSKYSAGEVLIEFHANIVANATVWSIAFGSLSFAIVGG